MKQTLVGLHPTEPDTQITYLDPAAPAEPQATRQEFNKKTLLGIAQPLHPAQAGNPAGAPPPLTSQSKHTPHTAAPEAPPSPEPQKKTLLGIAQPGSAPLAQPPQDPQKKTLLGVAQPGIAQPGIAPPGQAPREPQKRTLLGIAQPGIAPRASLSSPPPPEPTAAPPQKLPAELPSDPISVPPPLVQRKFPWWMAIAALLSAGAVGGLLALLTREAPQLTVTAFEVTPEGQDRYTVTCSNCPADASILWGQELGPLTDGSTRLTAPERLPVGTHHQEVQLIDAQGKTLSKSKLIIPIAFRLEIDQEGMHEPAPFLTAVVQAPPGSQVTLQDQNVPLKNGEARFPISFADLSWGEKAEPQTVLRSVSARVTHEGITRESSTQARAVITPLTLLTPAPQHRLQSGPLTVSGRTAPHAQVRCGESQTQASAQGEFSLVLPQPQAGKHRLAAWAEQMLLRQVEFELKPAGAPVPFFPELSLETALREPMRATGRVVETRREGERSLVLLETPSGCPEAPCLLRAFYAQPVQLPVNSRVTAWGELSDLQPLTLRAAGFTRR